MTLRRARKGINAAAALAVAWGVFSFTPRAQGADSISVFDRKGSVGSHTSIALDSAGMPVVVYYDASNQKVKVQVCQSVSCKGKTSEESPASATMGIFQGPTSVAVHSPPGASFPVIALVDGLTLKVLRCGDATCSLGNAVTSIDSGLVVYEVSVAVNASGFPVASYYTGGLGTTGLRVLRCTNATCSGDASTLVEAGDVGRFSSLKLDSAGNPVISYWDEANKDLVLLHCGNAGCTSGNTRTVVDANDAGEYTSLQLDASGNPVISYRSNSANTLKIARCSDANCTGTITVSAPDPATSVGQHTSLALDAAGNPVVAYYDFFTNNTLKILHCGDNTCSSGNTISMPDRKSLVGTFASLALPPSGNPIVAYYDAAGANLKLLICDDPGCQ